MEVIVNGNEKVKLPKNIKQIGTDNQNRKVYIEDYAYSFIKDTIPEEGEDGIIGVLLGRKVKKDKDTYILISGAVEITNAAVFTERIVFTEETWPFTRRVMKLYFDGMELLGWYLVSDKITDAASAIVNKADKENFTEEDSVFFLVNKEAGDEDFFERDNDNKLVPMKGYNIYYESNDKMQKYAAEAVTLNPHDEDIETVGQFRVMMKAKKQTVQTANVKKHFTYIYALSMLLIIVVLVIGINSINSYDRLNSLEDKVNGTTVDVANADVEETTALTPVTTVDGDIETTAEEITTEEPTTEEPTTEEPTAAEPATEEPTTVSYQTYVVKQGDSIYAICRQFYGNDSNDNAKKIMDFNGITSVDQILVGMTLNIPN